MSIEAVIARSRIAGGFAEHRRFTIARSRAIEKLRRFALPDPHDYALEFIQAAVANGAGHIDMAFDEKTSRFSYTGGGLRAEELSNLFDFLFASKDRTDVEHVRALALGINAALLFKPESVVIESGDGTPQGTSRMVLSPALDRVDVGRADAPLAGTFVALRGLDRAAAPGANTRGVPSTEESRIEERCLSASIPIMVNSRPLFGYTSRRTPALFGYAKVLAFDEGDLYGTIGVDPIFPNVGFTLLTRGVAIQTREHQIVPNRKIGGIVCFDRLRKTVDHAAIVDDDRLEELWFRLRHHAEQLVGGRVLTGRAISLLGGPQLSPSDLCAMLREVPTVVAIAPADARDEARARRASAVAAAIDAPALEVARDLDDWLRALSGRRVRVLRPDVEDDADVIFFGRPEAGAPPGVPLTAPLVLGPFPTIDIAAQCGGGDPTGAAAVLGAAPIEVALHVFDHPDPPQTLEISLRIAKREALRIELPFADAGHALTVHVPEADRAALLRDRSAGGLLDRLLRWAHGLARASVDRLAARVLADERAVVPGNARARVALQAAARSFIVRLRRAGSVPVLRLLHVGDDARDVVDLPVLRTHAGTAVSMRAIEAAAASGTGVVLAAAPGALPPGVDPESVIAVETSAFAILERWLGPAGVVRLDPTAPLVSSGRVVCLGFRPGVPCDPALAWAMAEPGSGASAWSDAERTAFARELVAQLVAADAGPRRAEARLLLQWAALACRDDPAVWPCFADLPVFLLEDGSAWTAAQLLACADGVRATFCDPILAAATPSPPDPDAGPPVIACSPVIARAIAAAIPVHPCVDVDLEARVPAEPQGLIAWVDIDDELLIGRVGVRGSGSPGIVVVAAEGSPCVEVHELASEFRAVGLVRLREAGEAAMEPALERLRRHLGALLGHLRARLERGELDEGERDAAIGHLLALARRGVSFEWYADGTLGHRIDGPLASAALSLPVLASRHGGATDVEWAIARLCQCTAAGDDRPLEKVVEELAAVPKVVVDWLRALDLPPRPQRLPAPAPSTAPGDSPAARLLDATTRWLAALRPDTLLSAAAQIRLREDGSDQPLLAGVTDDLVLNADHPIVRRALAAPGDPEQLAWVLLAVYGFVNAVFDPVLNTHELVFQQRVFAALLAGELTW